MEDFSELNLIGQSPAFTDALRLIGRFAGCDAAVLVQGETGTGKELAARAIHYLSSRRGFPFIPVNCGALPDALVENELFGHVRGAYTDARESQSGLVADAEGGTLFLDEIEALSAKAQVVLLRFIQDREYRPLGGRSQLRGNVRDYCQASNADLPKLVRSGAFRKAAVPVCNSLPQNAAVAGSTRRSVRACAAFHPPFRCSISAAGTRTRQAGDRHSRNPSLAGERAGA